MRSCDRCGPKIPAAWLIAIGRTGLALCDLCRTLHFDALLACAEQMITDAMATVDSEYRELTGLPYVGRHVQ